MIHIHTEKLISRLQTLQQCKTLGGVLISERNSKVDIRFTFAGAGQVTYWNAKTKAEESFGPALNLLAGAYYTKNGEHWQFVESEDLGKLVIYSGKKETVEAADDDDIFS